MVSQKAADNIERFARRTQQSQISGENLSHALPNM